MINRVYIFVIAAFIVFGDQFLKLMISQRLYYGQQISLIRNIVSITKVHNTGAAFSILQNNTLMLTVFSILVTILIIVYFARKIYSLPYITMFGWGLILGGTIGNLVDRVRLGYVIDFIHLDFINFPIFNLADFCINIGAALIIFYTLRQSFLNRNLPSMKS